MGSTKGVDAESHVESQAGTRWQARVCVGPGGRAVRLDAAAQE